MKWSQLKYLTAMMLIGDGVMALLHPQRDARAWSMGPRAWKSFMRYLSEHPEMLRAIGAAEIAVGMAVVAGGGTAAEHLAEETSALQARIRTIA
ncbi:MAG: hypothetical protein WAM66_04885 [Acidobacteriaceae bacterium]